MRHEFLNGPLRDIETFSTSFLELEQISSVSETANSSDQPGAPEPLEPVDRNTPPETAGRDASTASKTLDPGLILLDRAPMERDESRPVEADPDPSSHWDSLWQADTENATRSLESGGLGGTRLYGTNVIDVIDATHATLEGIPNFGGYIEALDGDDTILRDRVGWEYHDGYQMNYRSYISGGDGIDTIDYSQSEYRVYVMLSDIYNEGRGVAWQPNIVYGAGRFDYLYDIENVTGTRSHDTLVGDEGDNTFWAIGGHDEVKGRDGDDTMYGGEGNDRLEGENGDDFLVGEAGDDTLLGGLGDDTVWAGTGDDSVWGARGEDELFGGEGDDTISGGRDADRLFGEDGDDTLNGGKGEDTLEGGYGDDELNGHASSDRIIVDDGWDTAFGGSGDDTIVINGFGDNVAHGGSGWDTAEFGNAAVTINLLTGNVTRADGSDTLYTIENLVTGGGADNITGSNVDNAIQSGGGDDVINAKAGADYVDAGNGDDEIHGASGEDTIEGGEGADVIRGGLEDDLLTGGDNADTFVFGGIDGAYTDVITDFGSSEDQFAFDAGFFNDDNGDGFVELDGVLHVWEVGNDSWLVADTAYCGLQAIAHLGNVDKLLIQERIADRSILNFELDETELTYIVDWAVF